MQITQMTSVRLWLGRLVIRLGMAIIPSNVRQMFCKMIMYHVPGALTEDEKASVRAAAARASLTSHMGNKGSRNKWAQIQPSM